VNETCDGVEDGGENQYDTNDTAFKAILDDSQRFSDDIFVLLGKESSSVGPRRVIRHRGQGLRRHSFWHLMTITARR